ncbi:hypothetical protein GCM10023335_71420 [Streptomyces siamensis]|uniref:Histidine phosphatase family protein n=1 Tax=Streptomyces siamensis TaxID=1274986 RepID=A0ABP9JFQ7_9ACTN
MAGGPVLQRAAPAAHPGRPTPTMRQIILVRHAETAWNWPGRFYAGQYGPILTPAGESEATRGDRTA